MTDAEKKVWDSVRCIKDFCKSQNLTKCYSCMLYLVCGEGRQPFEWYIPNEEEK